MTASVYKGLFRGAAWTMTMRWSMRLIGFVNVIILARLLEPSDFGILAMATAVIGFAHSFTEMGAQQLLIRMPDVSRDDINAAWTVHVLQGLLVGALVFLAAGPAASYFNDDRIEPVVRMLAIVPVINGVTNIGLVLARKELNFALDFRAKVYARIVSFFTTLTLVLVMRDYWALIYGSILGAVVTVLISYLIHPYRPKLCFTRLMPYLRFGYSIVPMRMAKYGNMKAAFVVAGSVASTAQLGIYNIAMDLARLVTSELTVPLASGLFPGYAKINHDHQQLAAVFANVFATTITLVVPMGIGLGLVAGDLVPLLLGPNWLEAVPYIHWLSVALVFGAVNQLLTTEILIVSGFERRVAMLLWLRLVIYIPVMILAANTGGIFAIAQAEVFFTLCFFPVCVFVLTRSLPIGVGQILANLWRPFLSALIMVFTVLALNSFVPMNSLVRLIADAILGGITYCTVLYLTWIMVGSPQGIESLIKDQVVKRLKPSGTLPGPLI